MPKRTRRCNPHTGVSRGRMGRGVGSCDTHFNPGFFLHIRVVVLGLGAIDGDPLAGRSQVLSAADSGSLPVVHLHERGWTRRGRGCRCHRHEKARQGGPAGRVEGEQRGTGRSKEYSQADVVLGLLAQAFMWQGATVSKEEMQRQSPTRS